MILLYPTILLPGHPIRTLTTMVTPNLASHGQSPQTIKGSSIHTLKSDDLIIDISLILHDQTSITCAWLIRSLDNYLVLVLTFTQAKYFVSDFLCFLYFCPNHI